VSVDAPALRRAQRWTTNNLLPYDYSYLAKAPARLYESDKAPEASEAQQNTSQKVMYFAGCMSHLTPRIIKSVETIFKKAGVEYVFADRDGGICCGRPLLLAGKKDAAAKTIEANRNMILSSGCKTLVLSCPICYKVFKDEYKLEGIRVVHYTQYFKELVDSGKLKLEKSDRKIVYHDPCELGRGCNVYDEPRAVLSQVGELVKAGHERDESICCGGSLGSLTLNQHDRRKITEAAIKDLTVASPEAIVTACPLCLTTFSQRSAVPVKDFAEVLSASVKNSKLA
jgi:Fe-S oxidoreductase